MSVVEWRLRVTDNFVLDFCTFDVSLLQSAASNNVHLVLGLGYWISLGVLNSEIRVGTFIADCLLLKFKFLIKVFTGLKSSSHLTIFVCRGLVFISLCFFLICVVSVLDVKLKMRR